MMIDFPGSLWSDQSFGEIAFDQLTAALGRPAPSATAGGLDFQPLACHEHDLAFRKLRLPILPPLPGAAGPALQNAEAGMAPALRGKVDAHRPLAKIAQHHALAETAAIFSGATGIRN